MTEPVKTSSDTVLSVKNLTTSFLVDGEWKKSVSFNSLSNDYAHTNARDFAKSLVRAAASLAPAGKEALQGDGEQTQEKSHGGR